MSHRTPIRTYIPNFRFVGVVFWGLWQLARACELYTYPRFSSFWHHISYYCLQNPILIIVFLLNTVVSRFYGSRFYGFFNFSDFFWLQTLRFCLITISILRIFQFYGFFPDDELSVKSRIYCNYNNTVIKSNKQHLKTIFANNKWTKIKSFYILGPSLTTKKGRIHILPSFLPSF